MMDKNIGIKLMELRKRKGLTQQQLSQEIFYSDKVISKWERGESLPDIQALVSLAKFYGITIDDLVSDMDIDINKNENNNSSLIANNKFINIISLGISILFLLILFVTYFGLSGYGYNELLLNGYKILFASPNNFAGFVLIFSLWIIFLCNFYFIIENSTKLISPTTYENIDKNTKKTLHKVLNIMSIIGLILQIFVPFLYRFQNIKIGFFLITIIFLIQYILRLKLKKREMLE